MPGILIFYVNACHSVDMSAKLQAGWPRSQGSMPGRGKIFFFSPKLTHLLLGPTEPPVKWVMEIIFSG
jgi:hypothetical protein